MKYLVSPIQLGQLLQENDKGERQLIVEQILSVYYIVGTSDDCNLDDHIKINTKKRRYKNESKTKKKLVKDNEKS